MGWRVRVVHSTGYRYDTPVHQSYNEVRLTPRADSRQNVIVSRVETTPATRLYRYTDYGGTAVTAFDLHAPHKELAVVATSVVETADPQQPVDAASWAELGADDVRDRQTEMLEFTTYVGKVRFAKNGEWSVPRMMTVQYHGITGNDLDSWKKPGHVTVLSPAPYKTGNVATPFQDNRK